MSLSTDKATPTCGELNFGCPGPGSCVLRDPVQGTNLKTSLEVVHKQAEMTSQRTLTFNRKPRLKKKLWPK